MAKISAGQTVEMPTWIIVAIVIIVLFFLGLFIYNHEKSRVTVKTHGPYTSQPKLSQPSTFKH